MDQPGDVGEAEHRADRVAILERLREVEVEEAGAIVYLQGPVSAGIAVARLRGRHQVERLTMRALEEDVGSLLRCSLEQSLDGVRRNAELRDRFDLALIHDALSNDPIDLPGGDEALQLEGDEGLRLEDPRIAAGIRSGAGVDLSEQVDGLGRARVHHEEGTPIARAWRVGGGGPRGLRDQGRARRRGEERTRPHASGEEAREEDRGDVDRTKSEGSVAQRGEPQRRRPIYRDAGEGSALPTLESQPPSEILPSLALTSRPLDRAVSSPRSA